MTSLIEYLIAINCDNSNIFKSVANKESFQMIGFESCATSHARSAQDAFHFFGD